MCRFASAYYPESLPISATLVKIYAKLGLASLVTELSLSFPKDGNPDDEDNVERLGAYRYSVYTDLGLGQNMEELVQEYQDFFKDKVNENKNGIVTSLLSRDFEKISPLMQKNEKLAQSGF